MNIKSKILFITSLTLVTLFAPTIAQASCGMGVCPLPVAGGLNEKALAGTGVLPSQIALETRYVGFDIGGKGSYLQNALTGIYEHRYFRAGGILPLIYLFAPPGETFGLGNTTLFGEVYVYTRPGTRVSVGSQLETPTGNHDKGLGADHFMAVPYINWWQQLDNFRFALQLGFQQTLGQHEHGAAAPILYINPHTDTELMARLMGSYTFQARYSLETGGILRQVMAHEAVGAKTFLDWGFSFRVALGELFALRVGADLPVMSKQRTLYQAYASLFAYF